MTKNGTSSALQAGATFTGADGVQRRTIVAGAAWTIPVVATAIGAPLAAASGEKPTLAFTNGPYTVAACGTLKDVVIKATTDGTTAPTAGTPVTVTLPAGLTWSNGETGTRSLPTDGNGEVVLSGLKATGTPGNGTISAASSTNSTSAPVTVSGGASHLYILTSGSAPYNGVLTGVPGGSTPIGSGFWLKDGTIRTQDGAVIATNVAESAADFTNWGSANQARLTWTDTAGVAHLFIQTSGNAPYTGVLSGVPAGATPVGTLFWLKDGTVYGQDGAVIATDVVDSAADFNNWGSANQSRLTWTDSAGAAHLYILTSGGAPYSGVLAGVPTGATPVGTNFWLKDGTVYGQDGAVIATDVVDPAADFTNWGSANQSRLTWTDSAGVAHLYILTSGGAPYSGVLAGVPRGATPVGTGFWLKNGTVYGQDGAVISTGVISSGASFNNWGSGNQLVLAYATGATC